MLSRLRRPVLVFLHGANIALLCILTLWIGVFAMLARDGKLPHPPREETQSGVFRP